MGGERPTMFFEVVPVAKLLREQRHLRPELPLLHRPLTFTVSSCSLKGFWM
jgi:hypothetical protein